MPVVYLSLLEVFSQLFHNAATSNVTRIKVRISAKLLTEFKTAAKEAYPKEAYAILLGAYTDSSGFEITGLYFPNDVGAFSTDCEIKIQRQWFRDAYMMVRGTGQTILGDIHSHPSGELAPSECDIDQQADSSYRIFGICGIKRTTNGLRARVRFWPSGTVVKTKVI